MTGIREERPAWRRNPFPQSAWLVLLKLKAAASLDSCACGAVRILGTQARPGAVIMERLCGAGGMRQQLEPGAGRVFQVRKMAHMAPPRWEGISVMRVGIPSGN